MISGEASGLAWAPVGGREVVSRIVKLSLFCLRRSQYRTLKSAHHEHDARGLDGRVADPADLMFRSAAKNVAATTGFGLRSGAKPRSRK